MSEINKDKINSKETGSAESHDWELPGDLQPLESALAGLRPRPDRLDRERLMFLAGQASAASFHESPASVLGVKLEHRAWPTAFAVMTALAATLAGLLLFQPVSPEMQATPTPRPDASEQTEMLHARRATDSVLSASDAYRLTFEQLLARADSISAKQYPESRPISDHHGERKILTPRTWHQLLESPELILPSPKQSFNYPHYQGAQS